MADTLSAADQPRKITDKDRSLFYLIARSPALDDGWRPVTNALWPYVLEHAHPQLTEIDTECKRIRFSEEGLTVLKYLP